jgi:bacillithiol biosynthesis deacetylase BshB1
MSGETLDVLAVGAHPDDAELGCGGTLALLASQGHRVGLAHLTQGEMGTRGTAEERRREAECAAQALGAVTLDFLDCGDGGLRTGPQEEDAVIQLLRRRRPRLVLGPSPSDRHPDHGRAHRLLAAAAFYAGLRRRGEGEAHRPAAVFSYMQHDPFEPRFIVDVTSAWETKLASLACYQSQLHQEDSRNDAPRPGGSEENPKPPGPVTKVSTPEFARSVEGRARHFGQLVGAAFGEPFWGTLPLAVRDPLTILPGGVL